MIFKGIVQKGSAYGRKLGFPTANIMFDGSVGGIYAATVRVKGEEHAAAVYADQKNKVLEAHLLQFNDDLYDLPIEIELLEKIRDDKSFASEDEAKATITADVKKAGDYFNRG